MSIVNPVNLICASKEQELHLVQGIVYKDSTKRKTRKRKTRSVKRTKRVLCFDQPKNENKTKILYTVFSVSLIHDKIIKVDVQLFWGYEVRLSAQTSILLFWKPV